MANVAKASSKELWLDQRYFSIWWRFNKKKYNEDRDEGYFLEVDVQYLENLHKLHNDLPLLPERTNFEKVEKLVANLHDKNGVHIRNLKQALNHGLVLKKVIQWLNLIKMVGWNQQQTLQRTKLPKKRLQYIFIKISKKRIERKIF